jgi:hypothetical protein
MYRFNGYFQSSSLLGKEGQEGELRGPEEDFPPGFFIKVLAY